MAGADVVPHGPAGAFVERAARAGVRLGASVSLGTLTVDLAGYQAYEGGRLLALTARQIELLALLVADPGRIWSREQLHRVCWAGEPRGRRVDVHLSRIRAQLPGATFRTVRKRGWAIVTVA